MDNQKDINTAIKFLSCAEQWEWPACYHAPFTLDRLAKKHPEQAEKDQYISDTIEQLNELCDQIADLMETIEEDGVFSNWADMIQFLKEDIAL